MDSQISKISTNDDSYDKRTVNLDEALDAAGIGWYNIKYSILQGFFLVAVMIEVIGYSYVLPASACDLNMSDTERGLILSMPFICMVLASYPWGYLVDTKGRRKVIIVSSFLAGTLGVLSAFMPNLISFIICKFITSLCIACPMAVPYTFIGEILPQKYRDLALSLSNAILMCGVTLVPLFAWAVLPLDFRIDFGLYYFRSWRLLAIVYSSLILICATLMIFGPESPKFLVSQGRHDEALKVLQNMYAANKRQPSDKYPIKKLKNMDSIKRQKEGLMMSLKSQSLPLMRPPYLKWLALKGLILFGLFSTANGLYMWIPDILNRVISDGSDGQDVCQLLAQRLNQTETEECTDEIDNMTFLLNTATNIVFAVISTAISATVKFIDKKTLLVCIFIAFGTCCVGANLIPNSTIAVIILSSISMLGIGIGPITAFAVAIFPTHLRGMGVSLIMMIGRLGSVFGANVAGSLLNAACDVTFYLFGGLLYICGVLSLFLPRNVEKKNVEETEL